MSEMHVGTASVNWGFDPLYDWVTTPPFEVMLDEMASAGYEGTEISYHFPTDVELLRGQLQQRHLRAASTFHQLDLRDRSRHDEEIALAIPVAERLLALGCDILILSDLGTDYRLSVAGSVATDGSDGLSEAEWRAVGEGMNRVGEMLRERGMRGVVHPHVGTFIETREEIDRLCALTDPALIGLCPDTGHLAYAGADPEALFADYAERIWYVHLKDVDTERLAEVRRERLGFEEAVRRGAFGLLGTGSVNMPNIFAALRRANYSGWIIVEQDAPTEPLAAAIQNRAYLRETFDL